MALVVASLAGVATPVAAASPPPFVFATVSGHPAAGTSHSFPLVTGRGANDLSILCINYNTPPGATTYQTGWTLIVTAANAGKNAMDCVYRFNALGDTDTMAVTTANSVDTTYVGYDILGADPTLRITAGSTTGTSANPQGPAISVSPQTAVLVVNPFVWGNTAFATLTSYPATFGNNPVKDDSAAVSSAAAAMSTKTEFIGTEAPGAATISAAAAWLATTFAVFAPATGGSVFSSSDWTIILLLVVFLLVLGLGADISPLFFIIAGIAGVALGILSFNVTGSVIVTVLTAGSALMVMVFGVIEQVGLIRHEAVD